jgi:hypothetical protein
MNDIRSDGGFEAIIATMRDLATNGLPMASAAARVETYMRTTLGQFKAPDGKSWVLTKKNSKPLKGAANAYMQNIVGRSIVMKVMGRYAFHHFGAGHSPARPQLPEGTMPKELGNAIRQGLVDDFKAKTKAGKRGYRVSGLRAK